VGLHQLAGHPVALDGYNVLTTVEAALGGAVILAAVDQCFRDMASVHGSFRHVQETRPAIEWVGRTMSALKVSRCVWYLDQPVSNSGRLRQTLLALAADHSWDWDVQLVPDPDAILGNSPETVATSDRVILDCCRRWVNLARTVVQRHISEAAVVDLAASGTG
jgi:hypothetical protein